FDTIINRLQAQGYVITDDFVYLQDRYGATYGWGVAKYTTPEVFFGKKFSGKVYKRSPKESYERLFQHLKSLLPKESEAAIKKFLG
ncbi:MAG: hypothetical protein IJR58_06450, partial [Lachnospiraceae bacterium]|nr:hypothetical protein [Lachnospiraceae bacterium]